MKAGSAPPRRPLYAASLPVVGALLFGALFFGALACSEPAELEPGGILLVVQQGDDKPLANRLHKEAAGYLTALTGSAPQILRGDVGLDAVRAAARSRRIALVIALNQPAAHASTTTPAHKPSAAGGFRLTVADHGDWDNRWLGRGATFVTTSASAALGEQYALYEVLRRLGCRFYHPEQEYVPRHDPPDLRGLARRPTVLARTIDGVASDIYEPDFAERGFSFHGSHPLEHLESFSDGDHPLDEAENVNLWIVKNRGNHFRGAGRGIAPPERRARRAKELVDLAATLGFGGGSGITLHNQQQGSSASIDASSEIPIQQQIEAYVDQRTKNRPDLRWFGIHFGPTEFTVTPDEQTVQWINWAGERALANVPTLDVIINDHITGSQPTPHFDDQGCPPGTNGDGRGDYYDLAFHTHKKLGVKVHTVMFYALEGAAPVYNQKTFAHKLCLMKKASAEGRPLWWFPEGSWWLSFDNPIPVYLPLYLRTRGRDIELVKPLLASRGGGTLVGHRMFNSGHEWGYWQQDYAVGLWHWNADVSRKQVLGELFDPLCEPARLADGCNARDVAIEVFEELMTWQQAEFIDEPDYKGLTGGRFFYYSGEDPADEVAEATGFAFRPVRVAFNKVAKWATKELQHFRDTDLAALTKSDEVHAAWLKSLAAIADQVPTAGRPWLDEVVDGIAINQLRARQTAQLYGAVLAWRDAELALDKTSADSGLPTPAAAAAPLLAEAAKTLTAAEVVIRRREAAYRYPAAQTHGGGLTAQTAVANGTTYPWRVHTKTHLLTYWHNRHQRAADLIAGEAAGGGTTLRMVPAIALPGVALKATWPDLPDMKASVQMGDGGSLSGDAKGHDYGDAEGWWAVSGSLTSAGHQIPVAGHVARGHRLGYSPGGSIQLDKPSSAIAKGVLKSLFPPVRWAFFAGSKAAIALAPDVGGDGMVDFADVHIASLPASASATFSSQPITMSLPLSSPGIGEAAVDVSLSSVVFSGVMPDKGVPATVKLAGKLALDDVVKALIDLAGFDEKGALQTLSGILGFDPAQPPATVPFEGALSVVPWSPERN